MAVHKNRVIGCRLNFFYHKVRNNNNNNNNNNTNNNNNNNNNDNDNNDNSTWRNRFFQNESEPPEESDLSETRRLLHSTFDELTDQTFTKCFPTASKVLKCIALAVDRDYR